MSSCCGFNNGCNCARCRGVKLNQFPSTSTPYSGMQFVLANNQLVSYDTLLNDITSRVPVNQKVIRNISVTSGATVTIVDDILICTGTGNLQMPKIADTKKDVLIIQVSGTSTIVPDGTEMTEVSAVTVGSPYRAVPNKSGNGWIAGS